MRYLLLLLLSTRALAGDDALMWSHFSSDLKLLSVDSKEHLVTFSGQITVSGELVFEFAGNGHERDLLWARLIPDPTEIHRLPYVVGGFHPEPLHDIWIRSADDALVMAFGEERALYYSKGSSRYVSRRVTARLRDYASAVECDQRGYLATIVRIEDTPMQALVFESRNDVHGC